jgi:leucyl aminopeptidase
MPHSLLSDPSDDAVPVFTVCPENWETHAAPLGAEAVAFARAQGFSGKAGTLAMVPGRGGRLAGVLFGSEPATGAGFDPFAHGRLPGLLPEGVYRLAGGVDDSDLATLAFLLGSYRFDRYRKPGGRSVRLVVPDGVDGEKAGRIAEAVAFGRDLINTPANDLGPQEIESAARTLASEFGAECGVTVGDELLAANFPMIHAVGRASTRPPRLIDLRWGDPDAPKITLIGKGVAFDTGGLDIKPASAMRLMKKDMGGAATALAAARMIMGAGLPVRLRVLVPAVENAISGSAFRPGDVLPSRKGLTVEIENTDAEGRLILADALALADEEEPDLVLQFATLTGAARVALGPDLPPLFTEDDALAADLMRLGLTVNDPVWRLPLWKPYARMLESKIADIDHSGAGGFAGSITAALFLRRFVEKAKAYAHFDVYGWVPSARPGRPEGGEPQVARLVLALLEERFGRKAPL